MPCSTSCDKDVSLTDAASRANRSLACSPTGDRIERLAPPGLSASPGTGIQKQNAADRLESYGGAERI